MNIRFYIDPETDRPHVEGHGVTAEEVVQVLENAEDRYAVRDGASISIGQTWAGRYLKVVHRPDEFGENDEDVWVITAYPLTPKELKAHKRRRRK